MFRWFWDSISAAQRLLAVLLLLSGTSLSASDSLSGRVVDPAGRPVGGAVVRAGDQTAVTGADGAFVLALQGSVRDLEVSHPAFARTRKHLVSPLPARFEIVLAPLTRRTAEIVVQAVRADPETPVTKTDIDKEELERRNTGVEIPALLESLPSVTQYSDTGTGSGYNYLSLRGVGSTRVNFTLDGVPLAEPEDSSLYFVDFGDFASSLESVQVQRGVGTSSVGPASFVGSVNFASLEPKETSEVSARLGAGSFGTWRTSLAAHSGSFGPGFKLYVRGTAQDTDGFRDRSGVSQQSAFLGLSKETEQSYFKLFGFLGREKTQLAFLAADEATLARNLRENLMAPEERDRFGQQFLQAQYTRFFEGASLALQAYYNGADGWYRLFSDGTRTTLWQYDLSWRNLGAAVTFKKKFDAISLTWGAHGSDFVSDHAREITDGPNEYTNNGYKNEANTYLKLGWDKGAWHVWGDAQVRWARFRYEGDLDLGSVSWTFFNPKLGVRYDLGNNAGVYASVGRTTREPTRSDLFAGQDNPTLLYDLTGVKPEKVTAVEIGIEKKGQVFSISANLFAMEFRDEIALTGELSEIGLPLRRNVARSYRRGLEWDAVLRPTNSLTVRTSGSVSVARISEWTQFVDVYDAAGNWVDARGQTYSDVRPLLTPPFVTQLSADYAVTRFLTFGAAGRYVSRSYLDNTNSNGLEAPSWFRLDASATVDLSGVVRAGNPKLRVSLDNVLDRQSLFASGYSYLYRSQDPSGTETEQGIRYFYPLATRSFQVLLDLGF